MHNTPNNALLRLPAGTRAHSRQPQRMVGGLQKRPLSETRQTRPAYNGVRASDIAALLEKLTAETEEK